MLENYECSTCNIYISPEVDVDQSDNPAVMYAFGLKSAIVSNHLNTIHFYKGKSGCKHVALIFAYGLTNYPNEYWQESILKSYDILCKGLYDNPQIEKFLYSKNHELPLSIKEWNKIINNTIFHKTAKIINTQR
jgi:hypothetical protein